MFESPAKCEIRSVIRFWTVRNISAADIHRHVTEVYGTEAMSDSKVRKRVRKFKDGEANVHDEERSGRSSVITDGLLQAVESVRQARLFEVPFPVQSWRETLQ
ncbi:HTH_48 domain-containing protein [Trichonephila clavipes]|uniref:HTH_48 domain-containing protein n=1 Tax=Trichonephila clavipes TaxID=2585209 RepID=A0A8X6SNS6_TRICX|nr:HTH_48 domain-containing protein [Trichonephila clavipes]